MMGFLKYFDLCEGSVALDAVEVESVGGDGANVFVSGENVFTALAHLDYAR